MKGFKLNNDGDVSIKNNQIEMINDRELLCQTVKTILSTNKEEWFLNVNEGISFANILGKKKNDDVIRNEINQGLFQVDSSFYLETFSCRFDRENRKLIISFRAKNSYGDDIEEVLTWD